MTNNGEAASGVKEIARDEDTRTLGVCAVDEMRMCQSNQLEHLQHTSLHLQSKRMSLTAVLTRLAFIRRGVWVIDFVDCDRCQCKARKDPKASRRLCVHSSFGFWTGLLSPLDMVLRPEDCVDCSVAVYSTCCLSSSSSLRVVSHVYAYSADECIRARRRLLVVLFAPTEERVKVMVPKRRGRERLTIVSTHRYHFVMELANHSKTMRVENSQLRLQSWSGDDC